MAAHPYTEKICAAALAAALVITLLFSAGEALGLQEASSVMGYETRLFDASRVHTIDIIMDDWEEFLETCENEEYQVCSLIIDGEAERNAAIRAKGNTSLTSVAAYGNNRYSFKVEFDHYDGANTYSCSYSDADSDAHSDARSALGRGKEERDRGRLQ